MIIIDRFENGFAVCETDAGMQDIDISLLPEGAREGSVLQYVDGEYILDTEAECKRKERIFKLQENLFKKSEP